MHFIDGNFKCSHCLLRSTSRRTIVNHIKSTHNLDWVTCPECGKLFKRNEHLIIHMLVHTGEKNHKCLECGRAFAQKSALTGHLKTHSNNEKKYFCEICGEGFSKVLLRYHTHDGSRPHQCPHCEKAFRNRVTLDTHIRQHTGERPFSCDHCGKEYSDKSNLRLHIRVHHKEFATTSSNNDSTMDLEEEEEDFSAFSGDESDDSEEHEEDSDEDQELAVSGDVTSNVTLKQTKVRQNLISNKKNPASSGIVPSSTKTSITVQPQPVSFNPNLSRSNILSKVASPNNANSTTILNNRTQTTPKRKNNLASSQNLNSVSSGTIPTANPIQQELQSFKLKLNPNLNFASSSSSGYVRINMSNASVDSTETPVPIQGKRKRNSMSSNQDLSSSSSGVVVVPNTYNYSQNQVIQPQNHFVPGSLNQGSTTSYLTTTQPEPNFLPNSYFQQLSGNQDNQNYSFSNSSSMIYQHSQHQQQQNFNNSIPPFLDNFTLSGVGFNSINTTIGQPNLMTPVQSLSLGEVMKLKLNSKINNSR